MLSGLFGDQWIVTDVLVKIVPKVDRLLKSYRRGSERTRIVLIRVRQALTFSVGKREDGDLRFGVGKARGRHCDLASGSTRTAFTIYRRGTLGRRCSQFIVGKHFGRY